MAFNQYNNLHGKSEKYVDVLNEVGNGESCKHEKVTKKFRCILLLNDNSKIIRQERT